MSAFNYNSDCAHPRKIYTLMNKFINEKVSVPRTFSVLPSGITVEEFCDRVETGLPTFEEVESDLIFHIKKGFSCAAWDVDDLEAVECEVTVNFPQLMGNGLFAVRENAISRCPALRGFSKLILVLLHEVGHFATAEEAEEIKDDDPTCEETEAQYDYAKNNSNNNKDFHRIFQAYHYNRPHEKLATDWAINWLSDPENRKAAKAFEKAFFKAWRG